MNQFTLRQSSSGELALFPHIKEFALNKNNTVQLDSFKVEISDSLRIYYIIEGKFEWFINKRNYTLYPGDIALVLPGQEIGGLKGVLDIGTFYQLYIEVEPLPSACGITLGSWSGLSADDRCAIAKGLSLSNVPALKKREAADIMHEIRSEMLNQEMGYLTRVNHLIDSLLIVVARQCSRRSDDRNDFSGTFVTLERTLLQNLAHQWTVEEMASLFGLGTTAFTEKVKEFTGFSPLNYLIKIRISAAAEMLKRPDANFTNVALETGFYSSQHFSTTFKKLTGYTPGQFRKEKLEVSDNMAEKLNV